MDDLGAGFLDGHVARVLNCGILRKQDMQGMHAGKEILAFGSQKLTLSRVFAGNLLIYRCGKDDLEPGRSAPWTIAGRHTLGLNQPR